MSVSEKMASNKTPTYNLKAVVQETGIKPDTLRAWERRYGIPVPQRTTGGHRLYSQEDIDMLKWLLDRQEEGLSISRAILMWQGLETEEKSNVMEKLLPQEKTISQITTGTTIVQLMESWTESCLDFDEQSAEHVLNQALAITTLETVCFEILQKGLSWIGARWYDGAVTAQQEHFASALAIRRIESLLAASPPPIRRTRILIGCAAEDEHTFAPLLLTLCLRRRGWETLYLGANVPAERLESTVAVADPQLVILTAQTLYSASMILRAAELLKKTGVPLAFGGLVFNYLPFIRQRIQGHFLGEKLDRATLAIEALLASPHDYEDVQEASLEYRDVSKLFAKRQPKIDAMVWESLAEKLPDHYLARASRELGRNIIAALTLGDISLVSTNIEWLEGLLTNHHYRFPADIVRQHLQAYRNAVDHCLGASGQPLIAWFDAILAD